MSDHRERAGHLRTLTGHPGWAQVRDEFAQRRQSAEKQMIAEGTEDRRRAELAAMVRTIDSFLAWPERRAGELYDKAEREGST